MKLSVPATLALVLAASVGCSDRDRDRGRTATREPERQRRVIEPPVGIVRALPPHAIRADGVGPFRLGDRMSSVVEQLPSGPRIALFEIPGLLHRSLIRAEDDSLLIGGEPGSTVSSVSVLGPAVARTESGIQVGSTLADLERALGPMTAELDRAFDPRLAVPRGLRNARMVIEDDRIAAITITLGDPATGTTPGPLREAPASCSRPTPPTRLATTAFGACLTSAGELVEVGPREIVVRAAETRRTIATLPAPVPIVFAAPLRTTDSRDELVVVMHDEVAGERTWSLASYRFDAGRISRSIDPTVLYRLSTANARWIGADLRDVELYLELSARPDAIEVGGLLTTRSSGEDPATWRDVVVISPAFARRQGKPAPSGGTTAGSGSPDDAGVDAPLDAASTDAGAIGPEP